MNSLKGFMGAIVALMKILVWTLIIFYGLVGLWYLLNGNPKRTYEAESNAYGFAVQAFFYAVIVFPIVFFTALAVVDNEMILSTVVPPVLGIYLFGMFLSTFFGLANLILGGNGK